MRRPFGVAAIEVTEILNGKVDSDDERQFFIPFLQWAANIIYYGKSIQFKVLIFVLKAQIGLARKYLCDLILCSFSTYSLHHLRSSDQLDLFRPCVRHPMAQWRFWVSIGTSLWNGIPLQSAPPPSLLVIFLILHMLSSVIATFSPQYFGCPPQYFLQVYVIVAVVGVGALFSRSLEEALYEIFSMNERMRYTVNTNALCLTHLVLHLVSTVCLL